MIFRPTFAGWRARATLTLFRCSLRDVGVCCCCEKRRRRGEGKPRCPIGPSRLIVAQWMSADHFDGSSVMKEIQQQQQRQQQQQQRQQQVHLSSPTSNWILPPSFTFLWTWSENCVAGSRQSGEEEASENERERERNGISYFRLAGLNGI